MTEFFLKIMNMSISASFVVLAVLILRLVLKKVPKWANVLLWGIVAIRLLCPFSIESALSLIPSTETVSTDIMMDTTPTIHTGVSAINYVVNPVISKSLAPSKGASINPLQIWIPMLTGIWMIGFVSLLVYTAISYWRLRRKVSTAVLLHGNIFQSESVSSPFVLGIIKPKIYIPFKMEVQNLEHVIAHEQAHIRRKDYWWKPIGFLLLTIYWFNPLMWLAYGLLCRDIELACDEKVIKELANDQRVDYAQSLLSYSVNRRMITACPLAFGEVSVKERVKSVMNYKKPAFWIIVIAVIVCSVVAVCFLTNPKEPTKEPLWPTLAETREGYSAKQATDDGCVVLDGYKLLAGERNWIDFVNETKEGNSAIVRIYQTYTEQNDNYYVKELRYDGKKFVLKYYNRTGDTKEEFLDEEEYMYLVRCPYSKNNISSDNYMLANSAEVTAEGYYSSIFSSTMRAENNIYNHCHKIYTNKMNIDDYYNSIYGTAFTDIDNDGEEEKCCLGSGKTYGIFTFSLSVYGNEGLKYQNYYFMEFYDLSFKKDVNGILQVEGVTQGILQGKLPETHLFDIVLDGNEIKLLEDGKIIGETNRE